MCGFAVIVSFNIVITCAQSHSYPERAGIKEETLTVFMGELGQHLGFRQHDIFPVPLETLQYSTLLNYQTLGNECQCQHFVSSLYHLVYWHL